MSVRKVVGVLAVGAGGLGLVLAGVAAGAALERASPNIDAGAGGLIAGVALVGGVLAMGLGLACLLAGNAGERRRADRDAVKNLA